MTKLEKIKEIIKTCANALEYDSKRKNDIKLKNQTEKVTTILDEIAKLFNMNDEQLDNAYDEVMSEISDMVYGDGNGRT